MNEFLAQLYGTAEEIGAEGDDTTKLAQAEVMNEMFEAEGINVDELAPETLVKVAESLFGTDNEIALEDVAEETDESQEKLAEADFLGRVMAHSYVNEMGEIEKQAGVGSKIHEKALRLGQKIVGEGRLGRMGEKASKSHKAKQIAKMRACGLTSGKAQAKQFRKHKELGAGQIEAARKRMARTAGGAGYGAVGLGALGLGGAGYGASKALKKESALDVLAEQRAMEFLAENGVEFESGQDKLASAVEERAYEMLVEAGYIE
jgi:hypothetical protein